MGGKFFRLTRAVYPRHISSLMEQNLKPSLSGWEQERGALSWPMLKGDQHSKVTVNTPGGRLEGREQNFQCLQ